MCWIGWNTTALQVKTAKLSFSARPVCFQSIPHILPCIKLYSKLVVQVLVYRYVQFWWHNWKACIWCKVPLMWCTQETEPGNELPVEYCKSVRWTGVLCRSRSVITTAILVPFSLNYLCTALKEEIKRVREQVREKQRDCQKLKNEKRILLFHRYELTLTSTVQPW